MDIEVGGCDLGLGPAAWRHSTLFRPPLMMWWIRRLER